VAALELADERLERYAAVAVRVGANVGEGQTVFIGTRIEHAPLARALTRHAYAAGAKYVDVLYADQHVRRSMIELGPEEALQHAPAWQIERVQAMAGNAMLATTGDPEPQLMADLDGERVGRARQPDLARVALGLLTERKLNWTGVAYPNEGWARQVLGEPDVERLWDAVASCTRLDEDDPVEAWQEHMDRLDRRAGALNALGLDRLTYRGPGTDLEIGLLERSRFGSALFRTADGRPYVANMPTEEVFTTPDARRADGVVASTKPLAIGGNIVEGLQVRFAGGRIVDVQADRGVELIREQLKTDENAVRLGEIALVDGTSRVGRTGLTFFDTLYDENATCHIAYGSAVGGHEGDEPDDGINVSAVHTDFMIGGPEVDVDGVTRDDRVVPLLRDDVWQLPE
jgi:aminopeptidase